MLQSLEIEIAVQGIDIEDEQHCIESIQWKLDPQATPWGDELRLQQEDRKWVAQEQRITSIEWEMQRKA